MRPPLPTSARTATFTEEYSLTDLKQITLETLNGGVIPELFEKAFAEVLANIDDPSTDPKKPRTITIDIAVAATEDREQAAIHVKCKSKLVGVKPTAQLVYLVRKAGHVRAYGANPNQERLPFDRATLQEV